MFAVHRSVVTVERTHLFAQPIDVPFTYINDAFSFGHLTTQKSHGQAGRGAPDTTEFVDASCHSIEFYMDEKTQLND